MNRFTSEDFEQGRGLAIRRALGFIRYHSHLRDLSFDLERAARVPGLVVAGEGDRIAGVEDSRKLFLRGRSHGAPWAFAIEPGIGHAGLNAQGWLTVSGLKVPR